jgi:hypothetical protein
MLANNAQDSGVLTVWYRLFLDRVDRLIDAINSRKPYKEIVGVDSDTGVLIVLVILRQPYR